MRCRWPFTAPPRPRPRPITSHPHTAHPRASSAALEWAALDRGRGAVCGGVNRRTSDDGVGAVDDGWGVILLEACLLGLVVGARVLHLVRVRVRARAES